MDDLLYVGLSIGLFGLTWAYIKFCGEALMLDIAALICAVLLMVYLVVAMLYPEKF